jgi:eukaryotic-like serine/threonine-protein kinase
MMRVSRPAVAHVGGRYALYAEIASGGMATVHIGRLMGTAGFSRTVAIKRLLPQLARDPDFVAMFIDEARLAARIRHPNVVPTLDVLAADGRLLLVMEYIHGESLGRLLRALRPDKKRVPPRVATAILCGALHGLHAAHEARSEEGEALGIVHRDVSPQNVLVGADGVARVLDFGIAKAAGRTQTTREGSVKGKFAYMAPEQMSGAPVSRATDIYSASVVLWETLTTERLFEAETEGQLAARVLKGASRSPSSIAAEIPPELDAVTLRGLSLDPSQRFATAQDMALALEKACRPATAMEVGAWVEAVAAHGLASRAKAVAEIERASSLRPLDPAQIMSALDAPGPGRTVPLVGPRDASGTRARPVVEPPPVADRASPAPAVPMVGPGRTLRMQPSPGRPVAAPPIALEGASPLRAASSCGAPARAAASIDPGSTALSPRSHSRSGLVIATVVGFLTMAALVSAGLFLLRRLDPGGAAAAPPPASAPMGPPSVTAGSPSESAPVVAAAPPGCPAGMVRIPGGKFFMGADDGTPEEEPAHKVALSPYCLDAYEVTTADYKTCSDDGECRRAGTTNDWDGITTREREAYDALCNIRDLEGKARHPINCVDWRMAADYCHARGDRLPTEAEWEFAARGPDGRKYPWGDEEPSEKLINACGSECVSWGKEHGLKLTAMYKADDGWPTSAPVGSFPEGRSRYGVYDIVGNVWEWVADWYGAYEGSAGGNDPKANPAGPPSGKAKVIRGGGFGNFDPTCVRPSFRFRAAPSSRSYATGFRCARSL